MGGLRIPIEARSIYTAANGITAILATPHEDQTAIFLGSEQGHLLKVYNYVRVQTIRSYFEINCLDLFYRFSNFITSLKKVIYELKYKSSDSVLNVRLKPCRSVAI